MSSRQLVLLPLIAVTIIAGSYFVAHARSRTTTDAVDRLLFELADQPSPANAVATWSGRAAANPNGFIELTNLGNAHMRVARATGDISAYQRAEEAYRRALAMRPDYYPAGTGLAATLLALHEFDAALHLAETFTLDGRNPAALALVGDVYLALGDYSSAEAIYAQVAESGGEEMVLTRRAQLAWLHGDPQEALSLLRQATASADAAGDYRENLVWLRCQLGDLEFRTGDLDAAEHAFRQALKLAPTDHIALAGLARVAAARGELADARALYEQSVAIVPLPDTLAQLGDVASAQGDTAAAQQYYDTVLFIGSLDGESEQVYNRQLALFLANHGIDPDRAVDLTEREHQLRADVYGDDALAWALYAAGDAERAMSYIESALRLGTRDALLHYHAGMIALAVGRFSDASAHLTTALDINPHFDLVQARIARETLAELESR
ncbi:MAG: hypothetical protein DCC58_07175 [Chloroflexi bacterium]|nr:MAG: hypothetical protein DCC58_07175 [Chloroflexota bacterium]